MSDSSHCPGGNITVFKTVDIFNSTSGSWSISNLSVARTDIAATSLPNNGIAMFAGGSGAFFGSVELHHLLMCSPDVKGNPFSTVDIFNATSRTWRTASLSVPRSYMASTSLPNRGIALFAGGMSALYGLTVDNDCRVFFNLIWLFMLHVAVASGSAVDTVDVFNANSGTWTTAILSVAAMNLAATSLPDYGLAMFAGGSSV